MHIFRKNEENKSFVRNIFLSKYISLVLGLICGLITIFVWKATEVDSLKKLSQSVESSSIIYANNIEGRIDLIDYTLNELAGDGSPNTLQAVAKWDRDTEFYIQTLIGIENIVWIDRDLIVRRVTPTENSKYIIDEEINIEQNNSDYINLMFPIYNEDVIAGFILGNIGVSGLILSVGFEFENNYMIQVYDENSLLASSDNWQQPKTDISATGDISLKNKTFSFVLAPTKETVSLSTRNSYFILTFGLFLSVVISVLTLFLQVLRKNSKTLVQTQKRKLEILVEELQRTQLLLQASLNSPADMIILSLDKEYKYMFFNEFHKKTMKDVYNADVEIGKCILDFITSKDDIRKSKLNYGKALSGISHTTLELYGDLNIMAYETLYSPIRDSNNEIVGVTAYARDVSERINAEKMLKAEKNLAKKYFDFAGVMLLIIDSEGTIISMNKKGCEIIGLSKEDIIGKNWFDHFIPKAIRDELRNFTKKLFVKEMEVIENHENIILTASGEEKIISWANSLIHDDIGNVMRVLSSGEDVTEQRKYEKTLIEIGNHDYLTGLYNRRFFVEEYKRIDTSEFYPLGLMMMDVNGLKIINDALGHNVGDIALRKASEILRKCLRENDIIARIGGDEFAVILPNITDNLIENLSESLKKELKNHKIRNIELSMSIGYAIKTEKTKGNLDEILMLAENNMYAHKLVEGSSVRSNAINAILKTLTDKYAEERVHSQKVAFYCKKTGEALGLKTDEVRELELAGMYHDIGKISIPDAILNKPGRLTKEEFDIIKTHPEISYQILRAADEYSNLAIHALHHHEKWDGTGYPNGKAGEDIPLFSRIICVVDAFEAMTAVRVYKEKMSNDEAVKEIVRCSGTQFDKRISKLFVEKVLKKEWI